MHIIILYSYKWTKRLNFIVLASSSVSSSILEAAAAPNKKQARQFLKLTFRIKSKIIHTESFPPFLFSYRVFASASSRTLHAFRARASRKVARELREKSLAYRASNVGVAAASSIHDNNGTVFHPPPLRPPRRFNATVYHPAASVGPPFSPWRQDRTPASLGVCVGSRDEIFEYTLNLD